MCVLLNIALSTWDERRLRQAGIDTSAFGPAFLVPVYLFKRARMHASHYCRDCGVPLPRTDPDCPVCGAPQPVPHVL